MWIALFFSSKAVFDSEDCELVQAEKTNERKASRLLDILQTKSTESLVHFLDVVQLLNPGLYEKLTGHKATTSKKNVIISLKCYKRANQVPSIQNVKFGVN